MEMNDSAQRPRIWDVVSAEETAEYMRKVRRFSDTIYACERQLKQEEELETTRQEIEALPTIHPTQ